MKAEYVTNSGSWIGCSPKTYFLGSNNDHKRLIKCFDSKSNFCPSSTKGVPRRCLIKRDEFISALYDEKKQIFKKFHRLQFLKANQTMALVHTGRRALNPCYSKFFVQNDLVKCVPWD